MDKLSVLDRSQVAPPPATVTGFSLPSTYFDVIWLYSNVSRLLFFESPLSKSQFLETLVPQLKDSLSITLKHFLGMAGKLRIPSSNTEWPEIRYTDGDFVSFVVAESGDADFHHLTGNHARNAGEFYGLVPPTPPLSHTEDATVSSVLAVQVTLFPNTGFCIGFINLHGAADGSSIFKFMRMWALISHSQQGSNRELVASECETLPFYDRTVIKDPNGLGKTLWNHMKSITIEDPFVHAELPHTDRVRATFVISRTDIERLKKYVSSQRPGLAHLTSFTVICAYVWTCTVKSRLANADQEADEKETEQFGCAADCRSRLNPPIPPNYFGNCLSGSLVTAKRRQLLGEEGFVFAADLIGQAIHQKFQGEDCVLRSAENWLSDIAKMDMERIVSVAGSPKFNYYELDFGWGKPAKFEFISIDSTGAMSLSRCRDSEGDFEIGLSYPKPTMDAFTIIFAEGLKALI